VSQFRIAMVYGASAKHPRGQRVGLDHVLQDEGEPAPACLTELRADNPALLQTLSPSTSGEGALCHTFVAGRIMTISRKQRARRARDV
jgi:hypothetical protein